jgi:FeS assembly SUF system protein
MSEAATDISNRGDPAEQEVRDGIVRVLKTVFDPEIPVDIYELGLIYGIDLNKNADGTYNSHVRMTLTSPHCPAAAELPEQVRIAASTVEGVSQSGVEIVWDPPWDRAMMSEDARLSLGFF